MLCFTSLFVNVDNSVVDLEANCLLSFAEIDLKQASKLFAQKFACGSSVTGADEIVIQGDVKDDLFDLIPSKWPQVTFLQ